MNVVTSTAILDQLRGLIDRFEKAASDATWSGKSSWRPRVLTGLLVSAEAAIHRLAPSESPYVINAKAIMEDGYSSDVHKLECLIGIVESLRHDYESGALVPVRELIRAEVFDDFLEMAQHLLDTGYKDPAAVVVGSVLEGELRKLASRASLPVSGPDNRPLKAESLNASLAGKGLYNKLDQKSVTSWLDLRNKAAHGHYNEYTGEQVAVMLMGVRNFVSRLSTSAI